jgi:hypothetical protein
MQPYDFCRTFVDVLLGFFCSAQVGRAFLNSTIRRVRLLAAASSAGGYPTMASSRLAKLVSHVITPPGTVVGDAAAAPAAGSAGALRITEVDSFTVECPLTPEQQRIMEEGVANMTAGPGRRAPFIGFYYTTGVTRIRTTDPAITGYGWVQCPVAEAAALLVGEDPMDVERLLAKGLGKSDPDAPNTAKRPFMGACVRLAGWLPSVCLRLLLRACAQCPARPWMPHYS